MADARLSVLLSARDEASSVLQHVGSELGLLDKKASEGGGGVAKMGEGLTGLAKTAAGFALGGLVLNIGGDIAEQFKEVLTDTVALSQGVRRLQMDVGGSAESISTLLAVFSRFGVASSDAERTLSLFSRGLRGDLSASEASTQNSKSFSGTLAELGVEAADANGNLRPMGVTLLEVADGFKAHAADGQNAARAMALFGRSGRDLLPVLILGRDGIVELQGEAAKLGLQLTQGNVDSIRQFVKEQKNMGEAVEGLKVQLGIGLMPLFQELAKAGTSWATALNADGGKQIKDFTVHVAELIQSYKDADEWAKNFKPGQSGADVSKQLFGAEGGAPAKLDKAKADFQVLQRALQDGTAATAKDFSKLDFTPSIGALPSSNLALPEPNLATKAKEAQAAAADVVLQADTAELTAKKQLKAIDDSITAGDREAAIIQHDITAKTRESLDLKRDQASVELQLLGITDKRADLEREAAVTRAQMASNASSDALEGATFEERRLQAKIKADAIGGRGVSGGDIASLTRLAMNRPQLELDALNGGRGATLAERERQRAQQAQDLATNPLRQQQAEIQKQMDNARLNGVVDTTELQKLKQALDDRLFARSQEKADLSGGVSLHIEQHITATGEIDYDAVIAGTFTAVFDALHQATNISAPVPAFTPGSRGGQTGPF